MFHKTGYPSSVWYILGNEFCERFSYYGMHGKVWSICDENQQSKHACTCVTPITENCFGTDVVMIFMVYE